MPNFRSNADRDRAIAELRAAAVCLTPQQFDQLAIYLIEELDHGAIVSFLSESDNCSCDIKVKTPHPFISISYGVFLEHIAPSEALSSDTIKSVRECISQRNLESALLITTGSITPSAQEIATKNGFSLIAGDDLAKLLLEHEIGVIKRGDTVIPDSDFWELFQEPERETTIPSIEIPQADSLESLHKVLLAIDAGNHLKSEIAEAVTELAEDTFDPRQADYYGNAGWLLGLVHKERGASRWGLTRIGHTYLNYLNTGEEENARQLLAHQIRQMEVLRRILRVVRAERSVTREKVIELLRVETELSGTTVPRRTRTLIKWLDRLPEISVSGRGDSQRIQYCGEQESSQSDEWADSRPTTQLTIDEVVPPTSKNEEPTADGGILTDILSSINRTTDK